jgi:hypothetical protein
MWDFTKIPKQERKNFRDAYKNKDFTKLVLMHNKYDLSPYDYCCGDSDINAVFKWAKYGIDGWKNRKSGSDDT